MATIDIAECRAALTLIRRTIEEYCPPGVLPSEEAVNALHGPDPMREAEALATAIVATVDKLTLLSRQMPPASSIT
ncbi:MAG: hypothetical protein E5V89_00340 [Mesorhizobium sp.]|nr:MAG: hypothetical protein E5V89_00340 [Mesorhizobium sp.]